MPIYMDVHSIPGVKAKNVAEAHNLDMLHEEEYGCKCMTYWIDETRESVFCLIDAPDKDAVRKLHMKAHGLVPSKIIEVSNSVVQSFLGRIYDPENAEITEDGLKVFTDPSYRILLSAAFTDPVLLDFDLGKEKALELLNEQNKLVRKNMAAYNGSEAEHAGEGFIISFRSATDAVSCALSIVKDINEQDANLLGFKISITGGEPIQKSDHFFGDILQYAQFLSAVNKPYTIAVQSAVKQLIQRDHLLTENRHLVTQDPNDESLLQTLFTTLENNWQNAEFDIEDFCRATAMSQSQLYRKTTSLTGLSPNLLLKDFRLEKAKELMKQKRYTIAQITFDSGFTAPSYFTKCFKKKYGMLPAQYMERV